MYGQSYILGVQAWMAAPLFLLFGASVTSLKLPLLCINIAVAVLLVRLLTSETGLRPSLAALAAAPFILPAPGTAAHLLEASGGNLEPFLYVLLLWITRRRPWLCGAILGFGFMQRPFIVYGLVALLCMWIADRRLFTRDGLEDTVRIMASAAGMWAVVEALNLISSPAGPGTVFADAVVTRNNLSEVMVRTCIEPSTIPIGIERLLTLHWPELLGTAHYRLAAFSIESRVDQGYAWASVLPAAAILLALTGILTADRASNVRLASSICGFLTLVGLCSAAGYVIARCGELSFYTMRYELLSLLAVVALGGWFLSVARRPWMVRLWIAALTCWTLLAFAAHARFWAEDPEEAAGSRQAHRDDGARGARGEIWNRRLLDRLLHHVPDKGTHHSPVVRFPSHPSLRHDRRRARQGGRDHFAQAMRRRPRAGRGRLSLPVGAVDSVFRTVLLY